MSEAPRQGTSILDSDWLTGWRGFLVGFATSFSLGLLTLWAGGAL